MKDHKETIKTIAITILVTANLAFIGGVLYANHQNANIKHEVQSQISQLKDQLQSPQK